MYLQGRSAECCEGAAAGPASTRNHRGNSSCLTVLVCSDWGRAVHVSVTACWLRRCCVSPPGYWGCSRPTQLAHTTHIITVYIIVIIIYTTSKYFQTDFTYFPLFAESIVINSRVREQILKSVLHGQPPLPLWIGRVIADCQLFSPFMKSFAFKRFEIQQVFYSTGN